MNIVEIDYFTCVGKQRKDKQKTWGICMLNEWNIVMVWCSNGAVFINNIHQTYFRNLSPNVSIVIFVSLSRLDYKSYRLESFGRKTERVESCRQNQTLTLLFNYNLFHDGQEERSVSRRKETENAPINARGRNVHSPAIMARNQFIISRRWRKSQRRMEFVGDSIFVFPLATMIVKDVIQEMLDEDMIIQEKVGTQTLYWIFPSQSYVLVWNSETHWLCRRDANWIIWEVL